MFNFRWLSKDLAISNNLKQSNGNDSFHNSPLTAPLAVQNKLSNMWVMVEPKAYFIREYQCSTAEIYIWWHGYVLETN